MVSPPLTTRIAGGRTAAGHPFLGKAFETFQIIDMYEQTKLLGEGGFGKVFLAKHKEKGTEVAIKYIDISSQLDKASNIEQIYKESKTLAMLDHKHIIKMYQAFLYKKDFILIMEYAGGGELRELVEERGRLTEVETQMYMK